MTPSDPRYYYLANFERALAWLAQRYDDLLAPAEQAFLREFAALPLASRAVLVRMLMRRGDLFRTSKLCYEEIGDAREAIEPLTALSWIDTAPLLTLDTLFALLTKPELVDVFGRPAASGMRKSDWLEALTELHPEARPYTTWHPHASDRVVHVTIAPLCERLRLMFFGNLYQEWSEFVLADLGIFQYEQVAFDLASRAFQRGDDIDTYLAIHACRAALELGPDVDIEAVLLATDEARSDNTWLETRRAKLLFQIGHVCERRQDWTRAREAYEKSAFPGARHRLIRVLERSEHFELAWHLALEALSAPASDEETQRVSRMLPRLKRHMAKRIAAPAPCEIGSDATGTTLPVMQSPSTSNPQRTSYAPHTSHVPHALASHPDPDVLQSPRPRIHRVDVTLPRPTGGERVEWAVLMHLHRDEAPVHYVENTLINALFGLLCWPAIFEPLPGAFFHPFQSGPADLHAPDFHLRRAASFDTCFAALDDGTHRQIILDRFEAKYGLQSPFVAWGALSPALLACALDCIPATHLKRFFERLLTDIRAHRSGLPDLIQFWPHERRYALIEVKGPGDRLQDNQLRWIDYCATHGIPIDVMHVQWQANPDDAGDATRSGDQTDAASADGRTP
ncbi:MAG TPA: VRR-NUC domain-containing protein [Pararobbsia sp.]|nr:VRR-NUC domain-containing protein [Pararobbsia sp.]